MNAACLKMFSHRHAQVFTAADPSINLYVVPVRIAMVFEQHTARWASYLDELLSVVASSKKVGTGDRHSTSMSVHSLVSP